MACSVFNCPNSTIHNEAVNYFIFPHNPNLAQQWAQACGYSSTDQLDLSTARVCSLHFTESSYSTQVTFEPSGPCCTKLLRINAVPTLFPASTQFILKETNDLIMYSIIPEDTDVNNKNLLKYSNIQTREDLTKLTKKNESMKRKLDNLTKQIDILSESLEEKKQEFQDLDKEYQELEQQSLLKSEKSLTIPEQKAVLGKVFSDSQIKILCGKRKTYWSPDDMAVAYTIKHLSNRRCYSYLTKKMNFPLPGISSVKRSFTMQKRINEDK